VNTKRYAISLSMVLALGVSTGAQADKSEWFDVISYGNTTIAQDSPEDFGPWKMMVQPAAGPAPLASMALPDPIPPKPTPTPVVTPHITFERVTAINVPPPPPPPPPAPPPPAP